MLKKLLENILLIRIPIFLRGIMRRCLRMIPCLHIVSYSDDRFGITSVKQKLNLSSDVSVTFQSNMDIELLEILIKYDYFF